MTAPNHRLKAQHDMTQRHVTREQAERNSLRDRASTGMQAAVSALRDNPAKGTLTVAAITSALPVVAAMRSRSSALGTWAKRAVVWGSAGAAAAVTAVAWRITQHEVEETPAETPEPQTGTSRHDVIADLYGDDWRAAQGAVNSIATNINSGLATDEAQGWLDVLCDYLRSPSQPGRDSVPTTDMLTREAIVAVIARHLRREENYAWSELNFNFAGGKLPEVDFRGAHFRGPVTFARATFLAVALFDKARFDQGVSFTNATFSSQLSFGSALCGGGFDFVEVSCAKEAWFDVVTMESQADFSGVTFGERVLFSDAVFEAPALFERVTFGHSAWFDRVSFVHGGSFDEATFLGEADFTCARADVQPTFAGAVMRGGLIAEEGTVHIPEEIQVDVTKAEVLTLPAAEDDDEEMDTRYIHPR